MDRTYALIDDLDDPRIADYRAVRDRDLLGREGRPGRFIAESRLVVERLLGLPVEIESILVDLRRADAMAATLASSGRRDVPLLAAETALLRAIAGFDVHRGVLAIGRRPRSADSTLDAVVPVRGRMTLLLCEDITNADNMGGLYRVAAAFGVDAVILSPSCHDHLYRKSMRVSMGHALVVPTARSGDWQSDLDRLRSEWHCSIVAATPGPGSEPLDAIEPSDRVALVVGPEGTGLAPATLLRCDRRVRIPMAAGIDSLNVAVAAAVCLHRLSRSARA